MRMIFGVLGMLIVLAVVGVMVKKQYGALAATAPGTATSAAVSPSLITPQQQSQQLQNQIKISVEAAMQKTRPEADEK